MSHRELSFDILQGECTVQFDFEIDSSFLLKPATNTFQMQNKMNIFPS